MSPFLQNAVGGTYVGMGSTSLALQRRRGQANVVAVASNGCSCTGEMELQCQVMGELQKGSIAIVEMPAVDGAPAHRLKVTVPQA